MLRVCRRYSGAGPKQLWETFDYVLYDADYTIEEDVTVNNSMYLWTEQAGYPLINITETDGSVIVTQVNKTDFAASVRSDIKTMSLDGA